MMEWLRQTFKLFIGYLFAAFASIPFGLLYWALTHWGVNETVALIITLCIGLPSLYFAREYLKKTLLSMGSPAKLGIEGEQGILVMGVGVVELGWEIELLHCVEVVGYHPASVSL